MTPDQLESHKVHQHNQARRYACEFCGAKFIHAKHLARHRKNIHRDPSKHYNPRAPRTANKAIYPSTSSHVSLNKRTLPGSSRMADPELDQGTVLNRALIGLGQSLTQQYGQTLAYRSYDNTNYQLEEL